MLYGVGVSCRILYSTIVSYLYVSCSGPITSVGEERANLSATVLYCLLVIRWFLLGEVSSSSGCLGGLSYFIVALPEHSIIILYLSIPSSF